MKFLSTLLIAAFAFVGLSAEEDGAEKGKFIEKPALEKCKKKKS